MHRGAEVSSKPGNSRVAEMSKSSRSRSLVRSPIVEELRRLLTITGLRAVRVTATPCFHWVAGASRRAHESDRLVCIDTKKLGECIFPYRKGSIATFRSLGRGNGCISCDTVRGTGKWSCSLGCSPSTWIPRSPLMFCPKGLWASLRCSVCICAPARLPSTQRSSAREGNFAFLAVCARTQWILPLRQQTLVVKKGLGRCPSEFHADSETKSGHEHCFARLGWTGFGFRAETDNCMLVCVGRPGSSCQYANICMPGCQRCHVRLKAPVQGLEDNIQRHMNSPMMHDPFLCSTLCDFNFSQSKRRRQDQEQGGTWYVAHWVFLCSTNIWWTATPQILVTTAEYGRVSRTQLQMALFALKIWTLFLRPFVSVRVRCLLSRLRST